MDGNWTILCCAIVLILVAPNLCDIIRSMTTDKDLGE